MSPRNPTTENTSVSANLRFFGGGILVLLTLIFMFLTTFFGPANFGYSAISSLVVVQSVFGGISFAQFIDGSMSIEFREKLGGIGTLVVKATSGAGFAVFIALVSLQLAQYATPYELRLYLTDDHGRSIEEAKVTAEGADVVINKADHGWRVIVPASSRPADGKFSIVASNADQFLAGRVEVVLDKNPSQTIALQLVRDRSAVIRGKVVDAKTFAPVAGASIFVIGNENQVVTTSDQGSFSVASNAGYGEPVYVHAEKTGYVTQELVATTDENVQIRLPRR